MPVKESTIVKNVIKKANQLEGVYVEKRHVGGYSRKGNPDVTGCVRLISLPTTVSSWPVV